MEGEDMRVGIATDHGGFGLKGELLPQLREAGHEVVDFGAHSLNPGDDYPDFVLPLAKAVAAGDLDRGIAICGSGWGRPFVPIKSWAFVPPWSTTISRPNKALRTTT
jgi:RpiB/LacA/LacB family sugar-phosphate isomerase